MDKSVGDSAERQESWLGQFSEANQLMYIALEASSRGDAVNVKRITKLSELAFIEARKEDPLVKPRVIDRPAPLNHELTNPLEN